MLVIITLFFIIVLRQEKSTDTLAFLVTFARLQMELVIFAETFQELPEVQAFTSNNSKSYKTICSKVVLFSCFNQLTSLLSYAFMRRIMGTWPFSTLTSSLPTQKNVVDRY